MCGIVGYVGGRQAVPILLEGLQRLEYRGYDSAGLAVVDGGKLAKRRVEGKLMNLIGLLAREPVAGTTGIGHTRWATHGGPNEQNAHPHRVGTVAVVHNGIIENYLALKEELQAAGHEFRSETDTEVFAHLVSRHRGEGLGLAEAVRQAARRLQGAYAVVVVDASQPGLIVGARLASPLILALGEGENFVASDVAAVLSHTREVVFLDEGTLCGITADQVEVRRIEDGAAVPIEARHITWSPAMAEKSGHKHFMLKEIHEQPQALANTIRGRVRLAEPGVCLPDLPLTAKGLEDLRQVFIVACGTSWHAGLVGAYLFEDLAGLVPHVSLASELRYRNVPMDARTLVIAVSQSGETADTLQALKDAKQRGARVLSICNVQEASIPRASEWTLYTHAGPEIGVASTKAFTTQIVCLYLLALELGRLRGRVGEALMREELEGLVSVPALLEPLLADPQVYKDLAHAWREVRSCLFLGRGNLYPLALEGALKLKEISYIHAEGYAAGEMKHGPIALIEESVPTVILSPRGRHYEKVHSNMAEVQARGGQVAVIGTQGDRQTQERSTWFIGLPPVRERLLPLVAALPMQLIAYHVADFRGTDVDQPRNLAKSVTVE
jgi:glucosamine--fructose-6-phosphate aminotransferase (isomerizing)